MNDDHLIYDECVKELSEEAQLELELLQEVIINSLVRRQRKLTGISYMGAKEIIITLIRYGAVPNDYRAMIRRKRNERKWFLKSLDT